MNNPEDIIDSDDETTQNKQETFQPKKNLQESNPGGFFENREASFRSDEESFFDKNLKQDESLNLSNIPVVTKQAKEEEKNWVSQLRNSGKEDPVRKKTDRSKSQDPH